MVPRGRRIFCNRTLNLRSIRAIGYDMDYTLIHYHVAEWEAHAYGHVLRRLAARGWPVEDLAFDPQMMIRGLIIDTELGNVVKANRFGFVKVAQHGTTLIPFEQMRETYSRVIVDLSEPRWRFMNTLFSMSEACLYAQLVACLDDGKMPPGIGYPDLYTAIRRAFDEVHAEGDLKAEIVAAPERFVDLDERTALALLDQKHAKKKLMLITNSEWSYTAPIMAFAFDRFLPGDMTWRELFDLVIVSARKPSFFTDDNPAFEVVDEDGLLRPVIRDLEPGKSYVGGSAKQVQSAFGLHGDEVLYVGDHIFSDVNVSKQVQRWRTALILREMEDEIAALETFRGSQAELEALMAQKEQLEGQQCAVRVAELRAEHGYGPKDDRDLETLRADAGRIREALDALDARIKPLAIESGRLGSDKWGPLMRAGNDKSHLARQIERYADVYLARVSDFAAESPFAYLRSVRGSLPHDL
ncbi:MAG: HAD-IG family 5'-nucleotidase [Deltaproteobacteria bacterium]